MSLKRIATAALGLAFIAGCAASDGPVTYDEYIKQNYDVGSLGGAVTGPGVRVSVVGETYGADREALSDRLADILNESHFGPEVNFASRITEDDDWRDFEVRFLLSPHPGAQAHSFCTDREYRQNPPEAGSVVFLAAYCRKGRRLNSIRGRVAGDVDSPAFKNLVQQASKSLFPPPGYPFDSSRGNDYDQ